MTEKVTYQFLPGPEQRGVGVVTLNVADKLNALDLDMVQSMLKQLREWERDDAIACIWIQGAGDRAFCAGGDVAAVREIARTAPRDARVAGVQAFFETEYRLDYLLHFYAKPVVVWGHGIVMGGGIGLLAAASHRVLTNSSVLAMPEIAIGLYPDVGATWFLNRAPGRTGLFLGLTGAPINPADALFLGLADRFISEIQKSRVLDALTEIRWANGPRQWHNQVSDVLRSFQQLGLLPEPVVMNHFDAIQKATDASSLVDMAANMDRMSGSNWVKRAVQNLRAGCPITAHLVHQQYLLGRKLSLADAFRLELILSVQCALRPDFDEGVRAALIDKDREPAWQYRSIAEVPAQVIAEHFESPFAGAHPLTDLEHERGA